MMPSDVSAFFGFSAVLAWLAFGFAAAYVASRRGAGGCLWFGLGILLGPIGLAMAFVTGDQCQVCKKPIHPEATKCPYCHTPIDSKPDSTRLY
jgi:hypothetical protein